jgi:hypothetical protein
VSFRVSIDSPLSLPDVSAIPPIARDRGGVSIRRLLGRGLAFATHRFLVAWDARRCLARVWGARAAEGPRNLEVSSEGAGGCVTRNSEENGQEN